MNIEKMAALKDFYTKTSWLAKSNDQIHRLAKQRLERAVEEDLISIPNLQNTNPEVIAHIIGAYPTMVETKSDNGIVALRENLVTVEELNDLYGHRLEPMSAQGAINVLLSDTGLKAMRRSLLKPEDLKHGGVALQIIDELEQKMNPELWATKKKNENDVRNIDWMQESIKEMKTCLTELELDAEHINEMICEKLGNQGFHQLLSILEAHQSCTINDKSTINEEVIEKLIEYVPRAMDKDDEVPMDPRVALELLGKSGLLNEEYLNLFSNDDDMMEFCVRLDQEFDDKYYTENSNEDIKDKVESVYHEMRPSSSLKL